MNAGCVFGSWFQVSQLIIEKDVGFKYIQKVPFLDTSCKKEFVCLDLVIL